MRSSLRRLWTLTTAASGVCSVMFTCNACDPKSASLDRVIAPSSMPPPTLIARVLNTSDHVVVESSLDKSKDSRTYDTSKSSWMLISAPALLFCPSAVVAQSNMRMKRIATCIVLQQAGRPWLKQHACSLVVVRDDVTPVIVKYKKQ